MALYNNFPVGYQQQFYPPQNYQQQSQQQQSQQQIQNGGFIPVPSEDVARNYPVAPGNSVTFKDENAPYVYTKTMGFSQLDRPIFEKYKLIREEVEPENKTAVKECKCSETVDKLKVQLTDEIENIRSEIDVLKQQIVELSKTKEDGDD